MNILRTHTYVCIAVILFGLVAVFGLSDLLDRTNPEIPESYLDEDLSVQGSRLAGYSFGLEGLVADWYWMRSLQYIGTKVLNSKKKDTLNLENLKPLNPRLLYPLLDTAAQLDPKFLEVYSYGAIVLPAIDPKQAISITESGIKNNPNEWRLYQHLGYIYWKLRDYEKAAETYQTGSEIENAPRFLALMAAKMRNEGGSRSTAREIYEQMLTSAQDTKTQENARFRLRELDSLDEKDAVQKVLDEFKSVQNRCPKNWSEIFPQLMKVELPSKKEFRIDQFGNIVDPSDAPYMLDTNECKILIDKKISAIPTS